MHLIFLALLGVWAARRFEWLRTCKEHHEKKSVLAAIYGQIHQAPANLKRPSAVCNPLFSEVDSCLASSLAKVLQSMDEPVVCRCLAHQCKLESDVQDTSATIEDQEAGALSAQSQMSETSVRSPILGTSNIASSSTEPAVSTGETRGLLEVTVVEGPSTCPVVNKREKNRNSARSVVQEGTEEGPVSDKEEQLVERELNEAHQHTEQLRATLEIAEQQDQTNVQDVETATVKDETTSDLLKGNPENDGEESVAESVPDLPAKSATNLELKPESVKPGPQTGAHISREDPRSRVLATTLVKQTSTALPPSEPHHEMQSQSDTIICPDCNETNIREDKLVEHKRLCSKKPAKTCRHCGEEVLDFGPHLKVCKKAPTVVCNHCLMEMPRKALSDHLHRECKNKPKSRKV